MSSNIEYVLQLHREGKIDDNELKKALNALQFQKRRRNKKLRKRQKEKYVKVLEELVQPPETLKPTITSKCGYLRSYEISVKKYKDPVKLFADKKQDIVEKITTELSTLKGVKFQLALIIEFTMKKEHTTGTFYSKQVAVTNEIDYTNYDAAPTHILNSIEKFTKNGSGWTISRCKTLYLNIAKYEPLKGSSYIPLPPVLANTKAIINVKNSDNRCLAWALSAALQTPKPHLERISSHTPVKLNMEGIDFPTPISQISKVEKQNNLAINVYGYNRGIVPYYISDKIQDRINLMLLHNEETDNYHYCWIKNLNRLLASQTKHRGKHFCDRCLYGFSREDLLTKHKEDCKGINTEATRIEMPKEGSTIKFKNYKNQMSVPFVVYADFESIIKPHEVKAGDKTDIKTKHEACGYGYKIVRYDGALMQTRIYRGEDAAEKFLKSLQQDVNKLNADFANPKQ
jgi:hypothetical protein